MRPNRSIFTITIINALKLTMRGDVKKCIDFHGKNSKRIKIDDVRRPNTSIFTITTIPRDVKKCIDVHGKN